MAKSGDGQENSIFQRYTNQPPRPHQLGTARFHSDATEPAEAAEPHSKRPKLCPEIEPVEETDGEVGKKPLYLDVTPLDPIVTHNGQPFKEFAVFLPPKIPRSILLSKSALSDFVLKVSNAYFNLWPVAAKLSRVDLRLPPNYDTLLASDSGFLNQYLSNASSRLAHVESIGKVYFPHIVLSLIEQSQTFALFLQGRYYISKLFVPVQTEQQEQREEKSPKPQYQVLASILCSSKVDEITFISQDKDVQEFRNKLQGELKKLSNCAPKLVVSGQQLDPCGPTYAPEKAEDRVEKGLNPHQLVASLNYMAAAPSHATPKPGRVPKGHPSSSSSSSSKAGHTSSYTSDCTYSEAVELTADGPFTSELWNLSKLHQKGVTGKGVTLAVIDSGINYMHPAFNGRVIAVRNFVANAMDDVDCVIDSDGHGTLCAGIAAGASFRCPRNLDDPTSSSVTIPPGVAPEASLIICKVVSTSTGCVDSDAFVRALEWLKEYHERHRPVDVVSISLASLYFSLQREKAISDLVSGGVIVVCCASNVGRMRTQPISYPARMGHVLCVGAHDEDGKPTSFSPVGRELDFLAPGKDIWGPGPGTVGPFAMDCASGTSCATPGVAGLVCLVLHAISRLCEKNTRYQIGGKSLLHHVHNVWVMRELLKEMSSSPGHHSDEIGYGPLHPYRVLDRSPQELLRIVDEMVQDE